jgi:hypothetical protein
MSSNASRRFRAVPKAAIDEDAAHSRENTLGVPPACSIAIFNHRSSEMNDDSEKKRQEISRIEAELGASKLSRRGLLDRLKGVGVGFGAALVLGLKESRAAVPTDATARLKSSNPALNNILGEDAARSETLEATSTGDAPAQRLTYLRGFRRAFRRVFARY